MKLSRNLTFVPLSLRSVCDSSIFRVGRKFPPDKNYQIPETVFKLAQKIFGWNIPMGVGYNGIK